MYCNNCGKEIDDGSVYCTYCGTKLMKYETKEDKKEKPKNIILAIGLGILILAATVFLVWFIKNKSMKKDDISNISSESNETTTANDSTFDEEANNETTESDQIQNVKSEEYYPVQKYVVKNTLSAEGDITSNIDYDFDNGIAHIDLGYIECINYPEYIVPVYDYFNALYFWPNYLVPGINEYIYTEDDDVVGKEELEFNEQGMLTRIIIYNYENSSGEVARELFLDKEDDESYTLSDDNGFWSLTYDYDGKLISIILSGNGASGDFSYYPDGRIQAIEVKNEDGSYNSYRYDYDDENNIMNVFCDEEEIEKIYYDDNNVCFKTVDTQTNEITYYEYFEISIEKDKIESKEYSTDKITEDESYRKNDESAVESSKNTSNELPYIGEYYDPSIEEPALFIGNGEDGGYSITLDIYRLGTIEATGYLSDDIIYFEGTTPNNGVVKGTISFDGNNAIANITECDWDLLEVGTTFTYVAEL